MNKFCVITNREKDSNLEITNRIVNYINQNGRECILLDDQDPTCFDHCFTNSELIPNDTECAIVLGGDGTIIQAAFDLSGKEIPILGVNLGTLGFLAEIEKNNIYTALDNLFLDEYKLESRMMIHGNIQCNGQSIYSGVALNDIVISRSGFSRIISVCIYVNNELVDRYRGDGVIISTPTGSTGYSLSCGGPVVKPDSHVMIITPISPHSLHARTIVVSSRDKIVIKIEKSKKTQEEEAIATFDGRQAILLHTEDVIKIKRSKEETKLVKISDTSFFEILRTKIGQSGD
ncbi:MAG: kinase [Lachnospiraceae bacterium]|jgi:NAD+ kinase|nr:kinase [Lachnospiraceae bacterium]